MEIIELIYKVAGIVGMLFGLCYFYQIVYIFLPFFKKFFPKKAHKPEVIHTIGVLIAARNEEQVLPHLLDTINKQDYPAENIRVYVVADNCTDNTAQAAREKGAMVVERFNKRQVGKGYALNYLLGRLDSLGELDQCDAFLVLDADNLLTPSYIRAMNQTYCDGYEILCGYRNSKNFNQSWISSGYGLWYMHDSVHLNQSRMMLNSSCAVSGTGFMFSRLVYREMAGWNFFTLTEDIEFNMYSVLHGRKIGYCPDAMLYDEQPVTFRQSWRQRTRWSQGGWQVSGKYGLRMIGSIFRKGPGRYARFEMATFTMWWCSISTVLLSISIVLGIILNGLHHLIPLAVTGVLGSYGSFWLMGALVTLTEWKKIPGSPARKFWNTLTYPIYMLTWIPISFCSLFSKFEWKPIEHTVAVSLQDLPNK